MRNWIEEILDRREVDIKRDPNKCFSLLCFCLHFSLLKTSDIMQYKNDDLRNIVTPVKVQIFESLLKEAGYNQQKTEFLIEGFSKGFSLNYQGSKRVSKKASNLKLTVGSTTELWNKIMTEVKAKRYAGPFKKIPYKYFIQSPVGLVPKDKGKKTR